MDTYGRFRYYETPYYTYGDELFRLDKAAWEIRRYARVLDYEVRLSTGKGKIHLLEYELERNKKAGSRSPHKFSIMDGHLEKILAKLDHPSRPGLVWNNQYFSQRHRKTIVYTRRSSSGNSPLSLHPEILDEILKYVYLPKDVVAAYKNFEHQNP